MEINQATSFHPETFQFTNSAACSPGQYNFTDDVYALAYVCVSLPISSLHSKLSEAGTILSHTQTRCYTVHSLFLAMAPINSKK